MIFQHHAPLIPQFGCAGYAALTLTFGKCAIFVYVSVPWPVTFPARGNDFIPMKPTSSKHVIQSSQRCQPNYSLAAKFSGMSYDVSSDPNATRYTKSLSTS